MTEVMGFQQPYSDLVSESEIKVDLQASLRAATICGGLIRDQTLASCLLKIASNRISAIPFRAKVQPALTGSTQSGLPRGCLMRPSHGVEYMDTILSLCTAFLQGLKSLASCLNGAWHHENATHLLQSSTKPHKNVKKRWWFSKISTIWAKNPKVFQKLKNEKIYKNENANHFNNLLTTSFILSTNCKYKNKKIISLYISHSQPKTFFIITYVWNIIIFFFQRLSKKKSFNKTFKFFRNTTYEKNKKQKFTNWLQISKMCTHLLTKVSWEQIYIGLCMNIS